MTHAFSGLAQVLTPIGQPVTLVEVDDDWGVRPPVAPEAAWAIWGRLPGRGMSPMHAIRFAIRRELAIRRLRGRMASYRVRRIHRLPPAVHSGRLRSGVRRLLLQGAVAELVRDPVSRPVYEEILDEALMPGGSTSLAVSRDGSARIAGYRDDGGALLRMGVANGPLDPTPAANALRRLQADGVGPVPRLLASGTRGAISWTVESLLKGHQPARLADVTRQQTIDFLASLLRPLQPISSINEHAETLVAMVPAHAAGIRGAAASALASLGEVPSAIQHGDLIRENLLVEGDMLTGVVDWATWAASGSPAVDMLEMFVTERGRRPAEFATVLMSGAWESPDYLAYSTTYWSRTGIEPTRQVLRAIAIAWWLTSITALLARPDRVPLRDSNGWLDREVGAVLGWVSRMDA